MILHYCTVCFGSLSVSSFLDVHIDLFHFIVAQLRLAISSSIQLSEVVRFLVVDGAPVGNNSGHNAVTSNVRDGTHTVHEPVDSEDVSEPVRYAAIRHPEESVVCRHDQNETRRWNRSRPDATEGCDDDENNKIRRGDILTVENAQPDCCGDEVHSASVHVDDRAQGNHEASNDVGDHPGVNTGFD